MVANTGQITAQYVRAALERDELLTVAEFIKVTEFPIDMFMIDRFWSTLKDDQLIYVDDELIYLDGLSS